MCQAEQKIHLFNILCLLEEMDGGKSVFKQAQGHCVFISQYWLFDTLVLCRANTDFEYERAVLDCY